MVCTLTIIIPTFNSELTLHQALESLRNQTFDDFEILVIDGKSSDRTVSIAEDYCQRDKRINCVSERDTGVYDALNKGIEKAKGEWIYILGSDDRLSDENVLHNIFSYPGLREADVLYGNVHSKRFGGIYDGQFTSEKILTSNICHQSVFFRKEVFNLVGKFDTRYKVYADWDHNMRWFFDHRISKHFIDQVIAEYEDGGFSSSHYDELFSNEKVYNYLNYGGNTLRLQRRISLFCHEFARSVYRGRIKQLGKLICLGPKLFTYQRNTKRGLAVEANR
jgi:glycosyltransferase involved in cell wall biosynthesis